MDLQLINSWNCTAHLSCHNRSAAGVWLTTGWCISSCTGQWLVISVIIVLVVNGTANFTHIQCMNQSVMHNLHLLHLLEDWLSSHCHCSSYWPMRTIKLLYSSFNDVVVKHESFLVAVHCHLEQLTVRHGRTKSRQIKGGHHLRKYYNVTLKFIYCIKPYDVRQYHDWGWVAEPICLDPPDAPIL